MQKQTLAMSLILLLGACATSPNPPDAAGNQQPTASTTVLSIIGTPFLIALKIPICAATLAVVAPAAGISETVTDGAQARRVFADGLSSNCGPPYLLSP
jgi:hypothetical protein